MHKFNLASRISNLFQIGVSVAEMNKTRHTHTHTHTHTRTHTESVMGSQLLFHWVWNTINGRKERQFQASATRTLVCISVSFLFRVDGEVRPSESVSLCVCARVWTCLCVSHFCWLSPFSSSLHHFVLSFIGSTCWQCCLYVNTLSDYFAGIKLHLVQNTDSGRGHAGS